MPGQNHDLVGAELAQWLLPLGDYASRSLAASRILLVIENAFSFRSARDIWRILDAAGHPMIAACWDVFNAATIGEKPSVSVPTLNMRIQYAQVRDAKFGATTTCSPLGKGDVQVENFIKRLRGVGFEGYVTFKCETDLAEAEGPTLALTAALAKLRHWNQRLEISDWEAAGELK